MRIAIPKEIKDNEYRVGMTPAGVHALALRGHEVLVETGAGVGSGFSDQDYQRSGASIVPSHAEAFAAGELVIKVKEPLPEEYQYLNSETMLFTYLHLAADLSLTKALLARQVTAIAYETVQPADGSLPLLVPMSEVAGRMSVQIAARFLEKHEGGKGRLMGGVPGVPPVEVVIVGGGIVGTNAAKIALGMGANVTVLDRNMERLRYLDLTLSGRLTTLASNPLHTEEAISHADVLIGSVLVPGARAPRVVTAEMIARMPDGGVAVDVAIDQGGCFQTSRPTTHSDPVYLEGGILHYCVTNIPGAVPYTSTLALTNATLGHILEIADLGFQNAVKKDPALAKGVNTFRGRITYRPVAEAFGMDYYGLDTLH